MAELTHAQKMKIYREVILGAPEPRDESPEAMAYRREAQAEVQKMYQQGLTPELPWDSHDPDE